MADGALAGTIVILQNKNSGLVLDAGSDWKICQQEKNGEPQQQFKLIHKDKNIYYMRIERDGKALDLTTEKDKNGGELSTSVFHGRKNQQWCFEESSEGTWMITSALGAKRAITVPDNSLDEGCKLIISDKEEADNQRYYMQIVGGKHTLKLSEGALDGMIVFLQNKKSGLVLDAGKDWNLCQQTQNDKPPQQFSLVHVRDNIYHVINKNGKALDLGDSNDKNGAEITMSAFHGGKSQQWCFEDSGNGRWVITSIFGDNRAMSVPESSSDEGSNLIVWDNQNYDNQIFYMKIAGGFHSSQPYSSIMRLHGEEVSSLAHESGHFGRVVIAASQSGAGRVVACGHTAYANSVYHRATLHSLVYWVSGGATSSYTHIHKGIDDLPKSPKGTVVVISRDNFSDKDMLTIGQYVSEGGGLVVAETAWGWLQGRPKGFRAMDIPINKYLCKLGITFTHWYTSSPSVKTNFLKSNHGNFDFAIAELSGNEEAFVENGKIVKEALDSLPNDILESYGGKVHELTVNLLQRLGNDYPSKDNPVKKESPKWPLLTTISHIITSPMPPKNVKAPGIEEFPMHLPSPLMRGIGAQSINADKADFHPTGFYLEAGKTLKAYVESISGEWTIHIGAHMDDLTSKWGARRWPKIAVNRKIGGTGDFELASAFGGLVFLKSHTAGSLSIELTNIVPTATFALGQTEENWDIQKKHPGLWCHLSGHHIMFTIPSMSIRDLSYVVLKESLEFWDEVVTTHFELRGDSVSDHQKQWIVSDEQPGGGYMHAGYPIVTHMDVATPGNDGFVFDIPTLRQSDICWGFFHEIGHNMQRSAWTTSYGGETTCNIFALYSMEKVLGIPSWLHPKLEGQWGHVVDYIENEKHFPPSTWVYLYFFNELVHHFGWDAMKEVFRTYETLISDGKPPGNDQDKEDQFYMTFSRQVEYDLIPLYDFWNNPIGENARASIQSENFPYFLPDDQITKLMPNKMELLRAKYEDVVVSL